MVEPSQLQTATPMTTVPAFYTLPSEQVLQQLQTTEKLGLTDQQVAAQTQRYGLNELQEKAGRSRWVIFSRSVHQYHAADVNGCSHCLGSVRFSNSTVS